MEIVYATVPQCPRSHPPAPPPLICRKIVEAGLAWIYVCVREWVDRWITVFPRPLFAFLFKTACVRHTQKANEEDETRHKGRRTKSALTWSGEHFAASFSASVPSTQNFLFSIFRRPTSGPGPDAIGIFSTSAVLSRGISFCRGILTPPKDYRVPQGVFH